MAEKIKIKTIDFRTPWVNIVAEDGKKYSGNSTYAGAEGMLKWNDGDEVEVNVKVVGDKNYISIPKAGGAGNKSFAPKDYGYEKRKTSLEAAISSIKLTEKPMSSDNILLLAGKYYDYLNQK